jgi:hypothetical protein
MQKDEKFIQSESSSEQELSDEIKDNIYTNIARHFKEIPLELTGIYFSIVNLKLHTAFLEGGVNKKIIAEADSFLKTIYFMTKLGIECLITKDKAKQAEVIHRDSQSWPKEVTKISMQNAYKFHFASSRHTLIMETIMESTSLAR